MADAWNDIVEFNMRTGKTVRIEQSQDESGNPYAYVTNYDEDCKPLNGWKWEDDNVHLIRPTLAEAWTEFRKRVGDA